MKKDLSPAFLLVSVFFTVCLIASNLFATKIFSLAGINLPGAVVIFPISYILNDCLAEVWGYRKARLIIWTGFLMNLFVVLAAQLVVWLPPASFWDAAPHFNYVFTMAPRVFVASLLAFLAGSTMNAYVLSRMKAASQGKYFAVRAIVSSLAGEMLDSAIFMPIAFFGTPVKILLGMMVAQVSFKVLYEIVILPVTARFVAFLKRVENEDVIDGKISYNPFKIRDI
ncbi:MAG: queuosine precursor transporter [Bacteroidales bacterium]|nr:queuosine precursor transporter [Bacteroidales bacterium]